MKNGDFPFKTIAKKFKFIKDYMKPVIIPFDSNAREIIKSLDFTDYPAIISRKLQKYTVSIPPWHWDHLHSLGSIELKSRYVSNSCR